MEETFWQRSLNIYRLLQRVAIYIGQRKNKSSFNLTSKQCYKIHNKRQNPEGKRAYTVQKWSGEGIQ